jgi:thiol-disulfide isomerase/thioredoxin
MRKLFIKVCTILLFGSLLFAQEDRKVMVEIFTNSHCPLCPAAHNVMYNYLMGPNGNKVSYIFYHMVYPYNDDPLYWQSQEDSDARDNYYNPVSGTPQGWFDGIHQGNTSGWSSALDNLVQTQSPLKIILSGTKNINQLNINAKVTRTGNILDNDLVIHFVVVEDLFYAGRNGITNHKHVMRKMIPTPDGQSFTINLNETKNIPQTIDLDPIWDVDSLSVVVFVQSLASKTIYQSETISNLDLVLSADEGFNNIPNEFFLEQNYPNPFNPSTKIKYEIPQTEYVSLIVYNSLGSEVAVLVNEEQFAGSHEINFDATELSSGIYFYELRINNLSKTKKMILLK